MENLYQDFPRNFFPSRHVDGFFHDWFLVGEILHISVHYFLIHIIIYIHHAYIVYSRMVDHPPKEGVIVTQQYVLVLSVSVKYVLVLSVLLVPSVLLVHLFSGFSGSDIQDIYVIQCCTSTRHSTSSIHHSFI